MTGVKRLPVGRSRTRGSRMSRAASGELPNIRPCGHSVPVILKPVRCSGFDLPASSQKINPSSLLRSLDDQARRPRDRDHVQVGAIVQLGFRSLFYIGFVSNSGSIFSKRRVKRHSPEDFLDFLFSVSNSNFDSWTTLHTLDRFLSRNEPVSRSKTLEFCRFLPQNSSCFSVHCTQLQLELEPCEFEVFVRGAATTIRFPEKRSWCSAAKQANKAESCLLLVLNRELRVELPLNRRFKLRLVATCGESRRHYFGWATVGADRHSQSARWRSVVSNLRQKSPHIQLAS